MHFKEKFVSLALENFFSMFHFEGERSKISYLDKFTLIHFQILVIDIYSLAIYNQIV